MCTCLFVCTVDHESLLARGHRRIIKLWSKRALWAAVGDYKRKIPKVVLDIISKRQRVTPKQWANYTTASMAIKLYNG